MADEFDEIFAEAERRGIKVGGGTPAPTGDRGTFRETVLPSLATGGIAVTAGLPGDIAALTEAAPELIQQGLLSLSPSVQAQREVQGLFPEALFEPQGVQPRGQRRQATLLPTTQDIMTSLNLVPKRDTPLRAALADVTELAAAGGVAGAGARLASGTARGAGVAGTAAGGLRGAARGGVQGTGAGVGALGAESFGLPGILGEVMGGGVAETGISLAGRGTRGLANLLDVGLLTEGARESVVAEALQDLARRGGREPAQITVGATPITAQTPAELSGNPALIQAQRELEELPLEVRDGKFGRQFTRESATNRAIARSQQAQEAVIEAVPGDSDLFLSEIKGMRDEIDSQLRVSLDKTEKALLDVGDPKAAESFSIDFRERMRATEKVNFEKEKQAFNQFKSTIGRQKVTTKLEDTFEAINVSRGRGELEENLISSDIMKKAKEFDTSPPTLAELQDFRSNILSKARRAGARTGTSEGNPRLAANLNDAADEVLAILENADIKDKRYRLAIMRAKANRDIFRKGPVGDLLGFTATSAERTLPENTLFSITGDPAKMSRALAAVDDKGALAAESFLRSQFVNKISTPDGVNLKAAETYLSKNERVLNQFPFLKREIEDVVAQRRQAIDFQTRTNKTLDQLNQFTETSNILGGDVDDLIQTRLPSGKKAKVEMNKMFNAVSGSSQAEQGLKAAATREALRRSLKEKGEETKIFNVVKFKEEIDNLGLNRRFNKGEKSRLNEIIKEMEKFEGERKRLQSGALATIGREPPALLTIIARVVGARAGAAIGGKTSGGKIQSAGIGSRTLKNLVTNIDRSKMFSLMERALSEPEVFNLMMTKVTPKSELTIIKKLPGFLLDMNNDLALQESE